VLFRFPVPLPSRAFFLSAASVAYVGVAGALLEGTPAPSLFAALLILGLVWVWKKTGSGISPARKLAGRIARTTAWGLSLFLTARAGPDGSAALDAAANLGVGTVTVTSLVALARLEGPGGLLQAPRAARSLDAAVLVKPELRKHVQPYGPPPLEELFQFAVDPRIPVYV